ncbi:MAG TPA: PilZ domain-containing protein [Fibrobacteria bacterium]|nr:PilZ domain-containing protein [Fibrobacteria bacterium]
MSDERRNDPRWPVTVSARLTLQDGRYFDGSILNVNLGGCFVEGAFGLKEGDVVLLHNNFNPRLAGIYAQVKWVVDEQGLRGVGLLFQPMDDSQKFELIQWFNRVVGR